MTVTTVQVLGAIAEFCRVFGLLALVLIEGWIIYKLWQGKEALFDRLIESEKARADNAEANITKIVTEQTQTRIVLERLANLKNGKKQEASEPEPGVGDA